MQTLERSITTGRHPLDPLSAEEMETASATLRGERRLEEGVRAPFTTRHLWVTAHDPDQNFPAGDYPNQNPGGDGLPAYAAGDRPLEDEDLVVWYTFGAHHVVRPEDWPVMPVTHAGFQLKPQGLFDGNPALDVPPTEHCPS